jgi:hypothetical protein
MVVSRKRPENAGLKPGALTMRGPRGSKGPTRAAGLISKTRKERKRKRKEEDKEGDDDDDDDDDDDEEGPGAGGVWADRSPER